MEIDKVLIGRHVSVQAPEYLLGAAKEAFSHNYTAFMIYVGSPQSSFRVDYSMLKANEFRNYLNDNGILLENVIVHGSYLVNLANTTNCEKLSWSIDFLRKDLLLMTKIGLKTIVIHPGSTLGVDRKIALLNLCQSLNRVLIGYKNIRIALETMCGRANEIGATFEGLSFIINNVENKEQIGVCWDTCHMYSAGYDIKKELNQIIEEVNEKVGIDKLWVIHINDSINIFNSKKDRHANIGKGEIGIECLRKVVNHNLLSNIVKLLETPRKDEYYKNEVDLLRRKD